MKGLSKGRYDETFAGEDVISFVMTPGAQTIGNIAVYGSAKQLVI